MPILDIELVGDEGARAGLAAALADATATALASPGRTWVRLRILAREQYAEDGGGPPPGVRPVFVTVLRAVVPEGADHATEAWALAQAVAAVCERPAENVHVLYDAPAAGRIAFGGRLEE